MVPNEFFGDMSFLEDVGASATVVAETPTRVLALNPADIDALLTCAPDLASRFYRSLAVNLSRRLRDRTSTLPPILLEEVASARPFPAEHTRHEGTGPPASLVADVLTFKTMMQEIDRDAASGRVADSLVGSRVGAACDALKASLRRHVESDPSHGAAVGAYTLREAFPYLMASRFNDRAYTKPRGYAGDYWTIELPKRACG